MRNVQLVRLEPAVEKKLGEDPAYTEALVQDDWPEVANVVHRLVGRTLAVQPVSVDELHWDGYFVVDEASREVVGSCAFKAPPTDEASPSWATDGANLIIPVGRSVCYVLDRGRRDSMYSTRLLRQAERSLARCAFFAVPMAPSIAATRNAATVSGSRFWRTFPAA